MRQLQAALARLSSPALLSPAPTPTQTSSPPPPAEESMNMEPSAASSRASSPTHQTPQKRRSPSSDAITPHERDVVRETTCFLESFEQRIMSRFTRLEEPVCSPYGHARGRHRLPPRHLRRQGIAALETRQSNTEATTAHRSLPAPLTPAPTPTPPGLPAIHHGQAPPAR
ncbi:hypothetical protein MRX96_005545 [Rhipicephalus microplus]